MTQRLCRHPDQQRFRDVQEVTGCGKAGFRESCELAAGYGTLISCLVPPVEWRLVAWGVGRGHIERSRPVLPRPSPEPDCAGPGDGRVRARPSSRVRAPCTFTEVVVLRLQTGLDGFRESQILLRRVRGAHPHLRQHAAAMAMTGISRPPCGRILRSPRPLASSFRLDCLPTTWTPRAGRVVGMHRAGAAGAAVS